LSYEKNELEYDHRMSAAACSGRNRRINMQRWRVTLAGGFFLGMVLATMSLGCGDSGGGGQAIELPAGTQPITPPASAASAPADPNSSQGEPNTP
jgi:hypothetical protein